MSNYRFLALCQHTAPVMSTDKPIVVKIGGSTLGDHDSTIPDLVQLWRDGEQPVVVHGGGKFITEWAAKQGVPPKFVRGLRVTDRETLDIAIAVLSGLVNARLVAELTAAGAPATGISGVSAGLFSAKIANPELGYVGDVVTTNPEPVRAALAHNLLPVVAPAALNIDAQAVDDQILNINADTAAGHLAKALAARCLIFQTDVAGVMDHRGRVIRRMTARQAADLIESGVAGGGMIPKLEACLTALESVPHTTITDARTKGALLHWQTQTTGTRIG